jgi:hypothetical protein
MHDTTNHLIDSLPDPAAIRQCLKRNQAERSILRQMLKLSVGAQKRQDEIEGRINGIRELAEGLLGSDAAAIQKRIDTLDTMVVSVALFAEFQEAAKLTGDIVRKSLLAARDERTTFEANEAQLVESRKAFEAEKAQMAEDRKKFEAEQAAVRASTDAAKAAEEQEAQRKADVKAAAQRSADNAEDTKKRKAYLKKRLPQSKLVEEWAGMFLNSLESQPEIEDGFLTGAMIGFSKDVERACKSLIDCTKEVI